MNDGISHFRALQAPLFIGANFPTQGNVWFVKPFSGLDGNAGNTPNLAFKTVAAALAAATAGQNDIIYLMAESNTASATTDYQTATLVWNKDLVHLIGINSGSLFSQRSRIAFNSAYATASNLFTLSANGCRIENIEFFMGVASALPTGCMSVTGQRNRLVNCHIAGMGNTANDISGAYSLQLSGAQENLFEDCTIGQDTVQLGSTASNAVIYFAAAATRNFFRRCRVMLFTQHATNTQFLRAPAASQDRFTIFEDCLFLNAIESSSTNLTEAFTVVSNGGGIILAGTTAVVGATGWNATASGNVFATGYTPVDSTNGLAVAVTST